MSSLEVKFKFAEKYKDRLVSLGVPLFVFNNSIRPDTGEMWDGVNWEYLLDDYHYYGARDMDGTYWDFGYLSNKNQFKLFN